MVNVIVNAMVHGIVQGIDNVMVNDIINGIANDMVNDIVNCIMQRAVLIALIMALIVTLKSSCEAVRSPLFASLTVSLQRVSGPGEAGSTEIVSMVIEGASWATVAPPSARPLMLMARIRR